MQAVERETLEREVRLFHHDYRDGAAVLGFHRTVLRLFGHSRLVDLRDPVIRHLEDLGANGRTESTGNTARSIKCCFHMLIPFCLLNTDISLLSSL